VVGVLILLGVLLLAPLCGQAQQPGPPAPSVKAQAAPEPAPASPEGETGRHRFWDAKNLALFAGVGAMRALDYASTRNFRSRGRSEILLSNYVVDNKPLFVGIEAAGTAASIGLSYLFHRTGHHKLERWLSAVHIGVGTAGTIRNYNLKSAPGY
jgi:hypothetical protein